MSYPTGMGNATGVHYNNVAAQMQAYMNSNGGSPQLQPAGGHYHQFHHSRGPAFASHGGHAPQYGAYGLVANDVGGFARTFVRNLLN